MSKENSRLVKESTQCLTITGGKENYDTKIVIFFTTTLTGYTMRKSN